MNKFYKFIHDDIHLKAKQSGCNSRYDYFIKLTNEIQTIRDDQSSSDEYKQGYTRAKSFLNNEAKLFRDHIDMVSDYIENILRKSDYLKLHSKENANLSKDYLIGRKQAVNDLEYCLEESKAFYTSQTYQKAGKTMIKADTEFYKLLKIDAATKAKLSFCKTRYDYFVKLFNYITSIRHYYTGDYTIGYNEVKVRYLQFVENNKKDLDSLTSLLTGELGATSNRKITRQISNVESYQYRCGKIDALMDVNYCIKESKKFFMRKISEQLGNVD